MSLLFLYNNLLDSATLTASSATTGFPANNLKNPFRTKYWKTNNAGTANLVIDLTSIWAATGSNLVANWTNVNYDAFTDAAGNITNAEYTTAGTQTAVSDAIALTVGKLYKIVATETHTSGQHITLSGTGGVATTTLAAGANTIYFTATAVSSVLTVTNDGAAKNACTFTLYEMTGGSIDAIALTGYPDWAVAPGTLNMEFAPSNSWGAPTATEALTWVANTTPGGNKGTIIKKLTTTRNYPYARLNVVNAAGDWNLGRLFVGSYFEPARLYAWGYEEEVVDPSLISQTIGGQDHADEIERYRIIRCSGVIETQAQWVLYQAMLNAVGTRKEIFAAFDYSGEPIERTVYGKFSSLPGITRPFYFDYSFEFTESR
jgi:hypothetical protein